MIRFDHLALRRGNQLLIADTTFSLHPGSRTGITGANGCGKSSLFALLRGDLEADQGSAEFPPSWQLAHVAQSTPGGNQAAIEFVIDGDDELRALQRQLNDAEQRNDGQRIATLHGQLDTIDAYSAPTRAARILAGLGFSDAEQGQPLDSFSGGWRMRLNLARALMCRSDLLLLDEPTNHLDLDAVIWLQEWLRGYRGTLLLISHDRDVLDEVCDQIVHIEQQQATLYSGNYSAFERQRSEQLAQQQSLYERQQREVAAIRQFVDRFRAKATKARQAQSRLKTLERMTLIAPAHVASPFHFTFREPDKLPAPLLALDRVELGYNEPLLRGVGLSLQPGDRVALLGHNGAGKSTLLKLLAGQITPLAGQLELHRECRIGYFAQHQVEQLHPAVTPLEHLQQLDSQAPLQSLRDFLGQFGFSGERALEAVAPFSGGEKARLVLALLVYRKPNLLLLDEPTNHLDLEMRQALALALQQYAGALVVISHDRYLLRAVADELLLVDSGRVVAFDGDLDDYRRWLLEPRAAAAGVAEEAETEHSAAARKQRRREEAQQRQQLKPLRDELKKLEQQMAKLQERQKVLEQQLADPAIYEAKQKEQLQQVLREKAEIDSQLATVEDRWFEISADLEAAEG